jgi:hypothetical protein
MKILLSLAFAALFVFSTPAASAGSIPSLVGTWTVKSEGALMIHGKGTGSFTHWAKNQKALTAELQITSQEGRVIHGIFSSAAGKQEPFVAVIGHDKRLYMADKDGFLDGRIINKSTVEVIYRHVTATDTVVAAGIWTRKK